ncbi:succinate--CoA ligase subunit beta [Methylobacterium gnaphalii]|uniref:Succinate--CoA ligase [ADP-forming] subunit beta n=1 Tax=Methylobacterium gnaphalii TaxID=1010610 RepID=A0A512JGN0_9HYPH|nr:ATP-grasp domain-containing protein [Methylobacterium gnaphalii]GEP09076.1 succinate--CoA ligase [ADP-forming] subunit beta [Methylobacterium gnaphalii]GJD68388.1 Succinate--CoA ligase [GDP-forming] subunit beta [Methylobacterium gnaphalii]GLS49000.1 succinate--CoA ligase [ADP-forming] subunit beta [Methylobacterium gnaphalii]
MNFLEHVAKARVLAPAGIPVPRSVHCRTAEEAALAFEELGPCMVKAQVPTGKRGKAGGIKPANSAAEARSVAERILSMSIDGHAVGSVLLEEQARITREFYAAILTDFASRRPLVLFSTEGGMDIEEVAATRPDALRRHLVDIDKGFDEAAALAMLSGLDLGGTDGKVAEILAALYATSGKTDAELIEINPLAVLADGRVVALDCKLTLDDSAGFRQPELSLEAAEEPMTDLERQGAENGLKFIQLDGNVGVLANGAGLTMTTMDVIAHCGGRPANFLEIGGEAYTKSEAALKLVLSNPGVKSLVVNFCGAFARTDVMAEGVVTAWKRLNPSIPVFFSIHGTGEDEAVRLVREGLGQEPFDLMEDAVQAAVNAASGEAAR